MKSLVKTLGVIVARALIVVGLLLAILIGWLLAIPSEKGERAQPPAPGPVVATPLDSAPEPPAAPLQPAPSQAPPTVRAMGDCTRPGFEVAAAANAASLDSLSWAPFRGRAETGWRTYGPRIAQEIGAGDCAFDSPAFAEALSRWQAAHRLPADGRMTPETFQPMRIGWDMGRPFQRAARNGCPPPAQPGALQEVAPAERYGGKPQRVEARTLAAYRRMAADARAAGVAGDADLLTIFSGFRDPGADTARCAAEGGCGGAARANCSAHRTGTALDLTLGHAPGSRVDSADDANRRWMSQSPTYRWLVRNAGAYGFVNYAFEPWHWEWAG